MVLGFRNRSNENCYGLKFSCSCSEMFGPTNSWSNANLLNKPGTTWEAYIVVIGVLIVTDFNVQLQLEVEGGQ